MSQESVLRRDGSLFAEDSVDGFIHRAFLRGSGRSGSEIRRRPVIGICSSYSELNPCNGGLAGVADAVKRGVLAAGGLPLVFPTISISEPFSRPSSLLLRNLMAMDVEQMIVSSPIDAVVLLGGCDKTVPAQIMGAISANKPAIVVTAGPRPVGRWMGKPLTIDDLWPLADERRQGRIPDEDWQNLECRFNIGVGTCNVMGTAVTMGAVAEALGLALPGSALHPAPGALRLDCAERAGARSVAMAASGPAPRDVVTPQAIENAFRVVCAVTGSTNAIIHLAAISGRAGLRLGFAKLREWSASTPVITDVRPTGTHLLDELEEEGGIPAVIRELSHLMHLEAVTATGRSWADELPARSALQGRAIRGTDAAVRAPEAFGFLTGTLAPDGAVIKKCAASPSLLSHTGQAVVFDSVEEMRTRIDAPDVDIKADSVLVLRNAGPKSGMPEVGHIPIPRRLLDAGVTDMVRISDARMSGTATGTVVLHVAPESAVGGPLGLVRDGDLIQIDVEKGVLDLLVDEDELSRRQPAPAPQPPRRGYDWLHWSHVTQAPDGCDFDFLRDSTADDESAPASLD